MIKKIIILLLLSITVLFAGYKEGKEIFLNKCSSCHSGHVSMKELKINFFEKENRELNLKYSTVNMLVYAIVDSPTHIGDSSDLEMQQVEIEEYLKNYLEKPSKSSTISDKVATKYFSPKKPMKNLINEEEASFLAQYFMAYKKEYLLLNPPKARVLTKNYNEENFIKEANSSKRKIIVYATSKNCYFCKKMDKDVLSLKDVKTSINKDFIFLKVDVDKIKLPFNLQQSFKGMTPTFFFVSKDAKLEKTYPGAWKKDDFMQLLSENN